MTLRACTVCGAAFKPSASNTSRCPRHPREPVPRDRWYRKQRTLILTTSTHCGICGQPFTDPDDPAVLDHIIPRAAGGGHDPSNLQAAHRSCNARKGGAIGGQRW